MVKLPIYRISLVRERFTAYSGRAKLNCQQRATDFIIETMAFIIDTPVEELYVLSLDTKLKPIGLHHISTGTLDASLVHPRNIFQPLLLANAYAFFLLVIWRLKRYSLLALQTVPFSIVAPSSVSLVLFDTLYFGRRPGWRFGTV